MKVVILAGGLPSTLIEEDEKIPKPMAEIGGRPILWHIMKQYAHYGCKDFIICTGYKGEMIKEYFMNFYIYQSDITVDLQSNQIEIHKKRTEDWKVTVIDTGRHSSVSERILCIRELLQEEPFLVTYGDCVSDIDIAKMIRQHRSGGRAATFAAAYPTGRNKILPINRNGDLDIFADPSFSSTPWVNACSMVFEPGIFHYLDRGETLLGERMLRRLSARDDVSVYCHEGFWSPMETIRDKTLLEYMWNTNQAPWKIWED